MKYKIANNNNNNNNDLCRERKKTNKNGNNKQCCNKNSRKITKYVLKNCLLLFAAEFYSILIVWYCCKPFFRFHLVSHLTLFFRLLYLHSIWNFFIVLGSSVKIIVFRFILHWRLIFYSLDFPYLTHHIRFSS